MSSTSGAGAGTNDGSKAKGDPTPTSPQPSDVQSSLDANVDRIETDAAPEEPEIVAVRAAIGDALLKSSRRAGFLYLVVARERILDALTALRDDPATRCDYFAECLAVDYSRWNHERDVPGEKPGDPPARFEVVYNLMSVVRAARVFVKIGVDDGQSVSTAMHVYQGAEFPEKEIRDLFGIEFAGNEFLPATRFLLPDDWVGFPLRKEVGLGGEDVLFDGGDRGPAIEDRMVPHAGESFEGRTGSQDVSGR